MELSPAVYSYTCFASLNTSPPSFVPSVVRPPSSPKPLMTIKAINRISTARYNRPFTTCFLQMLPVPMITALRRVNVSPCLSALLTEMTFACSTLFAIGHFSFYLTDLFCLSGQPSNFYSPLLRIPFTISFVFFSAFASVTSPCTISFPIVSAGVQ